MQNNYPILANNNLPFIPLRYLQLDLITNELETNLRIHIRGICQSDDR